MSEFVFPNIQEWLTSWSNSLLIIKKSHSVKANLLKVLCREILMKGGVKTPKMSEFVKQV